MKGGVVLKININVKTFEKEIQNEASIINKLKVGEEQIKNGDVIDSHIVFNKLREKYGY